MTTFSKTERILCIAITALVIMSTNFSSHVEAFNLPSRVPSFLFFNEPFISTSLLLSSLKHERGRGRRTPVSFILYVSQSPSQLSRTEIDPEEDQSTSTQSQNRHEVLFQKRLEELRDFHAQHGHGSIPIPYPPNPPLGVWAANLRRQHNIWEQCEKNSEHYEGYLTARRRKQLLQAGFDFTSLTERQFQSRLKELQLFKQKYGHVLVPEKFEENPALGSWVSNMRSLYKRKRGLPSTSQIEMEQEDLAHIENGGKRTERRRKNILLQKLTPKRRKQQRSPRFSHLDEDKIKLLEDIGFVWSSIDKKWFEMLEWAKVYGVVNYHLSLASSPVNNTAIDSVDNFGGTNVQDTTKNLDFEFNLDDGDHLQNNTLLLKNYLTFVQNIQNQSLLPYFHPQDQILPLLLDENYARNVLSSSSPQSNNTHPQQPLKKTQAQLQSPPQIDYCVPPNNTLHYPLRIWFINQRSNYNRLHHVNEDQLTSTIPSTMTEQRQTALEEIQFPWSGRFTNRWEELQYELNQQQEMEKQREKETKLLQREREEREKVESLATARAASVSVTTSTAVAVEEVVVVKEENADIMDLWNSEDDDDDW